MVNNIFSHSTPVQLTIGVAAVTVVALITTICNKRHQITLSDPTPPASLPPVSTNPPASAASVSALGESVILAYDTDDEEGSSVSSKTSRTTDSDDEVIPPTPRATEIKANPNSWNRFTSPDQKSFLLTCAEDTHLILLGKTYKITSIFTSNYTQTRSQIDGFSFSEQEYTLTVKSRGSQRFFSLSPVYS